MDDSIYRLRHRDILTLCVLALLCLGVVMVQSAAMHVTGQSDLGLSLAPLPPMQAADGVKGVLVAAVEPGSPADTGGIRPEDILTTLNQKPLAGRSAEAIRQFHQTLRALPPGTKTTLNLMRGDVPITATVKTVIYVTGPPQWQWTERGTRNLIYAIIAILAYFIVGHVDYARLVNRSFWKNPIVWLMAGTTFLCLIVLIPHIGMEVNGARRWLKLGPVQVQPSELAKWAVVLFLAWWLSSRPVNLDRFVRGFLPTLIPIGIICLLVVLQDFGTAALIALCALTMLLAGRVKWWHLLAVLPPAGVAAVWFIVHKAYRLQRLTAFLDPWKSPQNEGYHLIQSLLSFSTGGLFGTGLGNGIQKLGYLPEDTTDFIFSVICEELGLFGAMLTVILYLGLIYVAWQAVKQKRDSFGRMLAFGIGSMIGLQAVINIAVATVSVPTKGLSLPLVSAGGSGLVITCAALGLLYSITRFAHVREPLMESVVEPKTSAGLLRQVTEGMWRRFTVGN